MIAVASFAPPSLQPLDTATARPAMLDAPTQEAASIERLHAFMAEQGLANRQASRDLPVGSGANEAGPDSDDHPATVPPDLSGQRHLLRTGVLRTAT